VRGFGFVTFATSEEATTARDSLDGSLQAGRPISVRPFSSEPPRREGGMSREGGGGGGPGGGGPGGGGGGPGGAQDDRTLYVGNLPYDVTQQEVSSLFTDNGLAAPVRTHLPIGPDGRLRGFGFVTCASSEAAAQSLNTLRNLDVRGRRLMVNIAHPRGERPPGGPGAGRPPREGGGFSGGGEPRFTPDAPSGDAGARPIDARRARNFGPPAPPGGSGGNWDDKKRKKKGGSGREGGGGGGKRERGGGGRHWGNDPDDD
jgi:RNA recognition motif-containing protein